MKQIADGAGRVAGAPARHLAPATANTANTEAPLAVLTFASLVGSSFHCQSVNVSSMLQRPRPDATRNH